MSDDCEGLRQVKNPCCQEPFCSVVCIFYLWHYDIHPFLPPLTQLAAVSWEWVFLKVKDRFDWFIHHFMPPKSCSNVWDPARSAGQSPSSILCAWWLAGVLKHPLTPFLMMQWHRLEKGHIIHEIKELLQLNSGLVRYRAICTVFFKKTDLRAIIRPVPIHIPVPPESCLPTTITYTH